MKAEYAASASRRGLAIFGPLPPPTTGMEVFTETLLHELSRVNDERLGRWVHVDTSISRSISERERLKLMKVARLGGQVLQSARLAAAGFDAYYPISQNRIGLLRDLALLAPFRLARRRIVVHLHGGLLDRFLASERPWLARAVRWALSGPSSGGIVLTPSLRHCLEPVVPTGRIAIVTNTALPPSWATQKERGPQLRVLFMSTLIESKGYRQLAEAVAALADTGVAIDLEIAGEPYTAEDAAWVAGFEQHPSVRFVGRLHGDEKWEALKRADVLALPTAYPAEGQPISIIEGMAAGCAIVATAREGIRDMVGPAEAVLLPVEIGPKLRADLEGALGELASDRDRAAELGRAARARYEAELTPERFREAWLDAVL